MSWVVDASVAAKWFFEEELTAQARDLLREGGDLIAPEIVLLEVENVAWKRVLRGEVSDSHARAVAATLPQMFARLMPLAEVAGGALELALTLRRPVYDCAYLALAETSGLPLITADDRLLARAGTGNWAGRATHLRSFAPTPTGPGGTQVGCVQSLRAPPLLPHPSQRPFNACRHLWRFQGWVPLLQDNGMGSRSSAPGSSAAEPFRRCSSG